MTAHVETSELKKQIEDEMLTRLPGMQPEAADKFRSVIGRFMTLKGESML